VSTLERSIGGGIIVDLIFNRHLSDISLSLLSKLRSLLYIGGAHICDKSLIFSLNKDASFTTACHNSKETQRVNINTIAQPNLTAHNITRVIQSKPHIIHGTGEKCSKLSM
jgi:hypothetical protein